MPPVCKLISLLYLSLQHRDKQLHYFDFSCKLFYHVCLILNYLKKIVDSEESEATHVQLAKTILKKYIVLKPQNDIRENSKRRKATINDFESPEEIADMKKRLEYLRKKVKA